MKPNYFTIHKNKPPKRLYKKSKRKANPFIAKSILIAVLGAQQVNILSSQLYPLEQKKINVLNSVFNTATAIIKSMRQAAHHDFLQRGHYTRKK